MRCPFCHIDNDRVVDTRACQEGAAIRRRRECNACKRRYSTFEQLEELNLKVVKKNQIREPFHRDKILSGLARACWKRPISDEQVLALVSDIEQHLYDRNESEIESREIGELIMRKLRDLDQVAFVRFASVYREFQDVRDFVDELQPMLQPASPTVPLDAESRPTK